MRKAYDVILSDYVDADTAAKNGGSERYRYECAFCWEEVHICAADSKHQATHFRHLSGNNSVECENYLGSRNSVVRNAMARRKTHDKAEFYFSSATNMFSIGVKFNDDELSAYEQNYASIQVSNIQSSIPIISVPIDRNRFSPNVTELFPITDFSWEYYVSVSSDANQCKYELFKKDSRCSVYPSFFKLQSNGNESNFSARLVRGDTLFTNTPYLIVFTNQYLTLSFQRGVQVGEIIKFRTMDRDFAGVAVVFNEKNARIEQQLESWKYKLEVNETLTVLWPPMFLVDDTMFLGSDYTYLYSTFELQAHGNTNARSGDISKLSDGVSKIAIRSRTKVYKKNAELVFDKSEQDVKSYNAIHIARTVGKSYRALDANAILFNRVGIQPVGEGASVTMTPSCEIRHYNVGYLDEVFLPLERVVLQGADLLRDILMHYKYTETFVLNDYETLDLSEIAFQYVESCNKTGVINSAVRRFIMEGRI